MGKLWLAVCILAIFAGSVLAQEQCEAPIGEEGEACCGSSCVNNNLVCDKSQGDGVCLTCGGGNADSDLCCPDDSCNEGFRCNVETGNCVACGGPNQPCCGNANDGYTCQNEAEAGDILFCDVEGDSPDFDFDDFNPICRPCSDEGELCCPAPLDDCATGFYCDLQGEGTPTCECGIHAGKPCCDGDICTNPDLVCGDNECVACGAYEQPCCDGDTCEPDLACSNGECLCGAEGLPCCEGNGCFEGNCVGGTCQCGAEGQRCCGGTDCDTNLACRAGVCECGHIGEPCCGGTDCDGGGTCDAPTCIVTDGVCGSAVGEPCCGGFCGDDLTCQSDNGGGDECVSCGGAGEPCCDDGGCGDDLICDRTSFTCECGNLDEPCCGGVGGNCDDADLACTGAGVCEGPCGEVDGACCDGAACGEELTCDDGVCRDCGGENEPCCPLRLPNANQCEANLRCSSNNVCVRPLASASFSSPRYTFLRGGVSSIPVNFAWDDFAKAGDAILVVVRLGYDELFYSKWLFWPETTVTFTHTYTELADDLCILVCFDPATGTPDTCETDIANNAGTLCNNKKRAPTTDSVASVDVVDALPAGGDPYYRGFDGQVFEFHGEVKEVFNLLSAPRVNLNVEYGEGVSANGVMHMGVVMRTAGLRLGAHTLQFSVDTKGHCLAVVDGTPLPNTRSTTLSVGSGVVIYDPDVFIPRTTIGLSEHDVHCQLQVRNPEASVSLYGVTFLTPTYRKAFADNEDMRKGLSFHFIDIDVSLHDPSLCPHGIWGDSSCGQRPDHVVGDEDREKYRVSGGVLSTSFQGNAFDDQ